MSKPYKALLIPFDDEKSVEVVTIDTDSEGLDSIYKRVAPDSRMFTVLGGDAFDLLGDDEGLLRSDAGERINARVMQLYAEDQNVALADFHSPLVGDWLVAGPLDEDGNQTDVPQGAVDFKFSWRSVSRG